MHPPLYGSRRDDAAISGDFRLGLGIRMETGGRGRISTGGSGRILGVGWSLCRRGGLGGFRWWLWRWWQFVWSVESLCVVVVGSGLCACDVWWILLWIFVALRQRIKNQCQKSRVGCVRDDWWCLPRRERWETEQLRRCSCMLRRSVGRWLVHCSIGVEFEKKVGLDQLVARASKFMTHKLFFNWK